MANTENITATTFKSLTDACQSAGISLRKACGLAGIDYQSIRKWKDREPKTIESLNKLNEVIANERTKKVSSEQK